jgi:hypothetical protein
MTTPLQAPTTRTFACGRIGDELIVVESDTLDDFIEFKSILADSSTFGDYLERRGAASSRAASWCHWFDDGDDDEAPDLDEPFRLDWIPGYGDGVFPARLGTIMLDHLDDVIWTALGDLANDTSLIGFERVEIPWNRLVDVRERLSAIGVELIDRQDDIDAVACPPLPAPPPSVPTEPNLELEREIEALGARIDRMPDGQRKFGAMMHHSRLCAELAARHGESQLND